jgi:hypothetical protein
VASESGVSGGPVPLNLNDVSGALSLLVVTYDVNRLCTISRFRYIIEEEGRGLPASLYAICRKGRPVAFELGVSGVPVPLNLNDVSGALSPLCSSLRREQALYHFAISIYN